MPRPCKNTKHTAITRNTPQPTINETSSTTSTAPSITIPSVTITDNSKVDVLSDIEKNDLNELVDKNTANFSNKHRKLSNGKKTVECNHQEVDNVLVHKPLEISDDDDSDTIDATIQPASPTQQSQLATLFINESKVFFLRIRKPTPELILSLARECARHLGITESLKAGDIKKKGCGWFSTWRVRLYDQCAVMAFEFLDRYSITMNDLSNSSHLRNFVSTDDIADIFEAQLKQIKKDQLFEDRSSLTMLKNYLAEAILIMVCYFVRKNIDCATYNNASKIRRTEWRSAILIDLHALDHMTVDLHVTSESGITIAQDINIRGYMNWNH
ncbi:hypothetical protein RhiirA5_450511 [Rhizophagus irregularis]|uniref:Uncharacterized protein n=1 Tax=Rhizophagus irregularis TaxID=588596 RepID=A0A2N0PAB7_9GLOM|nr:hypothetical protein RhiirA5_450511 [Rhizophagus irregularis]